jgi:hypothetical protein
MGVTTFKSQPTSEAMRAFLRHTICSPNATWISVAVCARRVRTPFCGPFSLFSFQKNCSIPGRIRFILTLHTTIMSGMILR